MSAKAWRGRVWLAGAAIGLAGACGGGESGGGGGGGGAAPACGAGDTRACLGPGQCAGAQVCLPDGSGYGACDCGGGTDGGAGASGGGGAGGGGSGGGGSGTGGAGGGGAGGAGAGGAGAGGGSGAGGSVGGTGGAGTGGGGGAGGDDPCFTPLTFDFTNCDPNAARCEDATCPHVTEAGPDSVTCSLPAVEQTFPASLRTPHLHGSNPGCCAGVAEAIAVRVRVPAKLVIEPRSFRVSVGDPWRFVLVSQDAILAHLVDYCSPGAGVSCAVMTQSMYLPYVEFMLFTTDPNAPSRNVRIEEVPAGTTCP